MLTAMLDVLLKPLRRPLCTLLSGGALLVGGCSATTEPLSPSLQLISRLPPANDASGLTDELSKPVVMIHFLASWCSLCAFELPYIVALRRNEDAEHVGIVVIAIDDSPEDAVALAARFRLPVPLVIDTSGATKGLFDLADLPTTVLINSHGAPVAVRNPKTGEMTSRFVGAYEWDRGDLLRSLLALK